MKLNLPPPRSGRDGEVEDGARHMTTGKVDVEIWDGGVPLYVPLASLNLELGALGSDR